MDNTSAVLNEILSELKTLKSDVQAVKSDVQTVKLNFKLMEEKLETIEKKLIQIQSTRNTPMVNDNARITPIRLALDGSGSIVMSSDTSIKAPNPRRMSSSTGEFVAQQIELQEESTTKSTSSSNLVPLTTTKKPSAFDKAEKSGESVIDTYLNMMKSEVAKVRVQDDKGSDISASIGYNIPENQKVVTQVASPFTKKLKYCNVRNVINIISAILDYRHQCGVIVRLQDVIEKSLYCTLVADSLMVGKDGKLNINYGDKAYQREDQTTILRALIQHAQPRDQPSYIRELINTASMKQIELKVAIEPGNFHILYSLLVYYILRFKEALNFMVASAKFAPPFAKGKHNYVMNSVNECI